MRLTSERGQDGKTRGRLPTFLLIGAMKAGTTTLYQHLSLHPQIAMSAKKELDFFVGELNHRRGVDWYRTQFRSRELALALGEASTSYSMYPHFDGVPGRIAETSPEMKLIYLLRHPIERIRSQYLHDSLLGIETRPPADAVLKDARYLDFSRYAMQIEQYLQFFPRTQLLLLQLDDLRQRRAQSLDRVFRFLGVDPSPSQTAEAIEANALRSKYVPPAGVRRLVGTSVYRHVSPFVPAPVKLLARRRLLRGGQPGTVALADDVSEELARRLADDVAALRPHLPYGFDGWGIA
jgi:hypothetical protein